MASDLERIVGHLYGSVEKNCLANALILEAARLLSESATDIASVDDDPSGKIGQVAAKIGQSGAGGDTVVGILEGLSGVVDEKTEQIGKFVAGLGLTSVSPAVYGGSDSTPPSGSSPAARDGAKPPATTRYGRILDTVEKANNAVLGYLGNLDAGFTQVKTDCGWGEGDKAAMQADIDTTWAEYYRDNPDAPDDPNHPRAGLPTLPTED